MGVDRDAHTVVGLDDRVHRRQFVGFIQHVSDSIKLLSLKGVALLKKSTLQILATKVGMLTISTETKIDSTTYHHLVHELWNIFFIKT